MIKVSIIIPIYNVEKYISRCLQSVVCQTYNNIEIICVDDCGQDKSMDIVKRYYKEYPELITIVHSRENVGLGGARDKGIRSASGDYITFIDSDDYIKKDYIEKYVRAAERSDADLIVGGYIRKGEKKSKEYPVNMNDALFTWVNISAWAKFYKRYFLQKYNLNFNGIRIYEDECFIYRVLLKQPKKEMLNYSGYYYWLNPNSITKNRKSNRDELFLKYAYNIKKFIFEYRIECEKNEILRYCLASGLIANLLYNGQGAKGKIDFLYAEYDNVLNLLGRKICRNKYLKWGELKSEPIKKKVAMHLIMKLRKIHCDKYLIKMLEII